MNPPEHMVFDLREAALHLKALADGIENGKFGPDDDSALEVHFGHILDHLCRAWNSRNMTHEEHMRQTEDEAIEMTNGVPNFQGSRRLFRGTCYEKEGA